MSGNFIYRHLVEPRVKLYSPREESFPVPLKYIDVSRTTHTNLDVKQEKRIDDYWNIDGSRNLSDPWTGFTKFTLLEEKAPDGHMWSGERLTRKQLTSRPDHLWPELWKSMGKHAKLKEKQKWSEEKAPSWKRTKIARDLFHRPWGYVIQRNHQERTFEVGNLAPAMPCKIMKNCESDASNKIKNKTCVYSGSWWIHKNAYGKFDTASSWRPFCRKRSKFIAAVQLGSQIYSNASSQKFQQQKQQRTRNGKNWRKFRRGTWPKSKVRKRWLMKQGRRALQFILHH